MYIVQGIKYLSFSNVFIFLLLEKLEPALSPGWGKG